MAESVFYRSIFSPSPVSRPVFFYHLLKCGGMSIYSMAEQVWEHIAALANDGSKAFIARCDQTDQLSQLRDKPFTFLASLLPFGAHQPLAGDPLLMTVLRDPIQRVRSAYAYHSMRAERPVDAEEFRRFLRLEENSNVMTKSLAGKPAGEPGGKNDLKQALRNLEDHFSFVATSKHIKEVCEAYLSLCGLPNVVSQRINQTEPRYMFDPSPHAGDIAAQNGLDADLFEAYRNRDPVLPEQAVPANRVGGIKQEQTPLHPITVILAEATIENESVTKSVRFLTKDLIKEGWESSRDPLEESQMTDLVESVRRQVF